MRVKGGAVFETIEELIIYNVASENGIRTQSSKVHPSPGAARSVWALPLTASCNMVSEENEHNHTEEEQSPTEEKDSNLLCCSDGSDILVSVEDIFDAIKNG